MCTNMKINNKTVHAFQICWVEYVVVRDTISPNADYVMQLGVYTIVTNNVMWYL